jgi:hypothetical protein
VGDISVDSVVTGLGLLGVTVMWLLAFGPGFAAAAFLAQRAQAFCRRQSTLGWVPDGAAWTAGCLTLIAWVPIGAILFYLEFELLYRVF